MREALAAGAVIDLFATAEAAGRHPELAAGASIVSGKDAAALSETVTPQGLVAVCELATTPLADVVASRPRLLTVLVEPNDPGNVGTIVRSSDAAGADAVVLCGGVDPFNGKAVRASAGSVFHLQLVECPFDELLTTARAAGLTLLAAAGGGAADLDDVADDGRLAGPTAWLFGTEAHGLPAAALAAADIAVRVPIHGRAESLNLAAAAAVCLYASARAQRAPAATRRPRNAGGGGD